MHFSAPVLSSALFATFAIAAPALEKRTQSSTSGNLELINQLRLAATGRDRINLLPNDEDFTYDFQNPPTELGIATGLAGRTVTANRLTMPSLIGTGSAMTLGFLGPCGMNTPHVHPRATELNIVVQGTLRTTMILENNARPVENTNTLFQMAVFPQGALHQEFNPDCEPTVFVAAFNDEDPGTLQVADQIFNLQGNVIRAALGGDIVIDGRDLESVRGNIPANVAIGVEECLAKCGIAKR